jgi:antitoxin (DNA-binding transcriptional repressor) of toxin-antitoxin stability system
MAKLSAYNRAMAKRVIHISEAEAASDFAALLARVRAGAEVVSEHDARPVAVVLPAEPTLAESNARILRKHLGAKVAESRRPRHSSSNSREK